MIYIEDNILDFNLDDALNQLTEQRREQALRFKHELGQRQCAASFLLLKKAIKKEYGIEVSPIFKYQEGGKPVMEDLPDIHFNISHCRTAVAVAIGYKPVGVDIECIRPFKEPLARHVLNDDEYATVITSERPDIEFIKLWTRKEALLKYTGEGIRRDLKSVLDDSLPITTIVDEAKGLIYSYIL